MVQWADGIAVIGMGCRYPNNIKTPDDYWRVLSEGKDIRTGPPNERWGTNIPDTAAIKGTFLEDIEMYDPEYFGLSEDEVKAMDAQQRVAIEVCCDTLRDAGYWDETAHKVKAGKDNIASYVGIANADGATLGFQSEPDKHTLVGVLTFGTSNRVAYCLGLQGPSMTLDTGCSSLGVLSPTYTTSAFCASANGYVRGEGCGAVLLKRLADAERDGDTIYGVIRGSSVGHNGKTRNIAAPSVEGQGRVMKDAMARGAVTAGMLDYVEAHATGTKAGDRKELQTIQELYVDGAPDRTEKRPLVVGAVKSMFGHSEGAAGIMGLMKTILVLMHRSVPPNIHFETLRADVKLDYPGKVVFPLGTNKSLEDREGLLWAGVNSFGAGGTNAHVVLQEYPAKKDQVKVFEKYSYNKRFVPVVSHAGQYFLSSHIRDMCEPVEVAVPAETGSKAEGAVATQNGTVAEVLCLEDSPPRPAYCINTLIRGTNPKGGRTENPFSIAELADCFLFGWLSARLRSWLAKHSPLAPEPDPMAPTSGASSSPRRQSPSPLPSSPPPPTQTIHRKRLSVSKLFPPAHAPVADPKSHFLEREIDNPDVGHARAHGHAGEADWAAVKARAGQSGQGRMRTLSTRDLRRNKSAKEVEDLVEESFHRPKRRASHDDNYASGPRRFFIEVAETQRRLIKQEDTDGDCQITVTDSGPKVFAVGTAASAGYHKFELRGTYQISNLLQELALAADHGRSSIMIDQDRLAENPVDRLSRMISFDFWDGLSRRIDAEGLEIITNDPKNRSPDQHRRIYVPFHDDFAFAYWTSVAQTRPLDVVRLPEIVTPQYVKSLDGKPGILSLALKEQYDPRVKAKVVKGVPFVVPGGRFNEMYGWDSYFETLGLLVDKRVEMSRGMVENFVYEIAHYGKILNANRSYYLTRSQPPFLTDMILKVHNALTSKPSYTRAETKSWLARGFRAAVKELLGVWMSAPRYDKDTGLSTYTTEGYGMPPETESSHFDHLVEPYAKKHGVGVEEFKKMYAGEEVSEPELDAYFVHDRAVRESGHDTTYRFEGKCANLTTIDLTSLLYRYEMDLARVIQKEFRDSFKIRVRRGPDNANLKSYIKWRDYVRENGVTAAVAEWDSSWARHVLVFDEEIDHHWREVGTAEVEKERESMDAGEGQDLEDTAGPQESYPADEKLKPSAADVPVVWDPVIDHPDSPFFTITITSPVFQQLAARRRAAADTFLWNDRQGIYFDYDVAQKEQHVYETVTTFWALWAGMATPEQADSVVVEGSRRFEVVGGLVSGTLESRGRVGLDRPNRQWDYPFGRAPHHMMAWEAVRNYGYKELSQRFAYRWLYTITKAFVDYNGVVPEKFDVVDMTHKVDVEYGNVGTDFKFVPREGFGWMNASYQVGLTYLSVAYRRALGMLTPPDDLVVKFRRKSRDNRTGPMGSPTGSPDEPLGSPGEKAQFFL
ncbi:alpha,alpha-trehalase nth1 [Gonapodya sp. JEL0774]|nr:alpha,alpha-trehalase nth1 [Gonapodya sp. JEL0774]